jgi:hypothetical protein
VREILFAYPSALLHTTCLEIGPELSLLETRHGIYCTLCYSITPTDHGGVGRSMKADSTAGERAMRRMSLQRRFTQFRSRAITSPARSSGPKQCIASLLQPPKLPSVRSLKFRDDTSLPSPSPSDGPKFFCRHLRFSNQLPI